MKPMVRRPALRRPCRERARARRQRRRALQGALHAGMELAPAAISRLRRRGQRVASPHDNRLPDVDADAQKARLAYWDNVLKQLDAIPAQAVVGGEPGQPRGVPAADREPRRGDPLPRLRDAVQQRLAVLVRPRLHDPAAAEERAGGAQLHRASSNDVPRYFDEQTANMRAGLKRGFSVPRAVLDGRDVSIASYAEVKSPEDSEFYKPFKNLPATIPADEQASLRTDAQRAIREQVIPAYAKLLTFFRDDYVPHARKTLAAEAMPDGKAYYRQQIKEYTTLDLDPEAIHADRPQGGRAHRCRDAGDDEGRPVSRATSPAFLHFLRSDPQFYAKTPEELLMRAAWIAKQVDGKLSQYFGLLPRGRFGIEPVPAAIAPFWTAGRGGAHTYWVNTYDLPSRPLYNLPALTLHESAPGPRAAGRARRGTEGPAGVPQQELHLRVRRGLGAVLREARQGDGHLPHAVRGIRPPDLRDVARRATGHRHRHPPQGLDARAGDRVPRRAHRAQPARGRDRGRSLHLVAGPGAQLQARRDQDRRAARAGREGSSARSSICALSTTRCSRSARCRCRCWKQQIDAFIAAGGPEPKRDCECAEPKK